MYTKIKIAPSTENAENNEALDCHDIAPYLFSYPKKQIHREKNNYLQLGAPLLIPVLSC